MTSLADQLRNLTRNSRWHAAYWLVSGERHPQEHWYITERLAGWRKAVQSTGHPGDVAAAAREILAEFDRERAAEAANRMVRAWIMPNGRVAGLGAEEVEPSTPEPASAPRGGAVDALNDPSRYTDTQLETIPAALPSISLAATTGCTLQAGTAGSNCAVPAAFRPLAGADGRRVGWRAKRRHKARHGARRELGGLRHEH